MKRAGIIAEVLAPWAGLVVGMAAAGFVHQFGSDGTFDACATHAPGPVLIAGVIGLIASAAAGLVSWRSLRGEAGPARRIVAIISTGSAALFVMAILLPMIAALMLPPCFG